MAPDKKKQPTFAHHHHNLLYFTDLCAATIGLSALEVIL